MDGPFSSPTPAAQRCARAGCASLAFPCSYSDGHDHVCAIPVCEVHGGTLVGKRLCARHLRVEAAYASAPNPELVVLPEPDDRRFGVLLDVHSTLSPLVVQMLSGAHPDQEGLDVAADTLPKQVRRIDQLAWEQGWACFSRTGNLDRVVLRLGGGEPPRIDLLVNQETVLNAVPYWISRRRSGAPPDSRDRAMYARHLADAVQKAISATAKRPEWLVAS